MSEKNVEEVKSLLKEIKSKFFESYVDYLFDDEKCNFYWNQVEEELNDNSWIIVENELQSKIIAKNSQNFWKEKLNEIGGEYIYFSNSPENPTLN